MIDILSDHPEFLFDPAIAPKLKTLRNLLEKVLASLDDDGFPRRRP
jgi:hypothetical protein